MNAKISQSQINSAAWKTCETFRGVMGHAKHKDLAIPTLQKLMKLGYTYIPPSQAFKQRKKGLRSVLLEDILEMQLRKLNHISYRKRKYAFSDENIFLAIEKLRRLCHHYTAHTNQEIYEFITSPQSLTQTIEGHIRNFDLFYIDWKNWENNVYHCTSEYSVEHSQSAKTVRSDIVLFINGIPLAVIDCKSPEDDIEGSDLPHLFTFGQKESAKEGSGPKKDFGLIIDYANVLGELDKAIDDFRAKQRNDLEYLSTVSKFEGLFYDEMAKDLIIENHQNLKACEEANNYCAT